MKNNSTQRSEGQQTIVNIYEPGVNDELATVNDSNSIVDSLESADGNQNFGVNDDLAQFSEATISIRPRPNKNDPARAGSFVFLCQIIFQPIFNAVELFKNSQPALIPIRVKDNNGSVKQK